MDIAARDALERLGPLDGATPGGQSRACKVCRQAAAPFDVVDFAKCANAADVYPFGLSGVVLTYYRCGACGFVFTPFMDDWSPQDFARFVYNDDYVKVDPEYLGVRPRNMARAFDGLLQGCQRLRILDYGSGSGIFADVMREAGYAGVESYDPFSSPARPHPGFDIITALEVIEHTTDPLAAFEDMKTLLAPGGAIIFSQALQPPNIATIRGNWWYIAPRNGHICAFTDECLMTIAAQCGLRLHLGGGLFAAVADGATDLVRRVAERIGPSALNRMLCAPGGEDPSWNGLELAGATPFRWTRAREVHWRLRVPSGLCLRLRLAATVVNEIVHGFASECVLVVDGRPWPTRLEDGRLVAEGDAPAANEFAVVLQTPEPRRPRDVHGAPDDRLLGVALAAE